MASSKKDPDPSLPEILMPKGGLPAQPSIAPRVDTGESTEPRAPLRVLVRPKQLGAAVASLSTRPVVIIGPAPPETWGAVWRPGDVEGVVWAQARKVNEVIHELRQNPDIVDVLISGRDVQKK